jgi:hypothetical protein
MAVTTEGVENAERDLKLQTRDTNGGKKAVAKVDPEEQLRQLRQRIKAGQNAVGLDPRPKDAPACKECFQRGWMAALRALEE